jgi:hypothetical protein
MNASDRNAIIRSFVVAISIMFFACVGIFYIGKTVITDPIMDKLDTMQIVTGKQKNELLRF